MEMAFEGELHVDPAAHPEYQLIVSLQQTLLVIMRMPSVHRKVEAEMAAAKLDIIAKMVPQGPNVVRHLALPPKGQTPAWIDAEMDKMDAESSQTGKYLDGKVSGAVYRASFAVRCIQG